MKREKFIQEIISNLKGKFDETGEASLTHNDEIKEAKNGFKSLLFDFPVLCLSEIEALNIFMKTLLEAHSTLNLFQGPKAFFQLTNKFLENVQYCACSMSSDEERAQYAELAALVFVKLFHHMLRFEKQDLQHLLCNLQPEPEPTTESTVQQIIGSEQSDALEIKDQKESESSCTPDTAGSGPADESVEVWAAEEDPDDFEYEDGRPKAGDTDLSQIQIGDSTVVVQESRELTWDDLATRLIGISLKVSFNMIGALSNSAWKNLELYKDIKGIITLLMDGSDTECSLFNNSSKVIVADLERQWPRFAFLLRDHLLLFPHLDSAEQLSFVCNMLERNVSEPLGRESCIGLLILQNLAESKEWSGSAETRKLCAHLQNHIPRIVIMLEEIGRRLKQGKQRKSKDIEGFQALELQIKSILSVATAYYGLDKTTLVSPGDDLISSGLLRSIIQMAMVGEVGGPGYSLILEFLGRLTGCFPATSSFCTQVPLLMGTIVTLCTDATSSTISERELTNIAGPLVLLSVHLLASNFTDQSLQPRVTQAFGHCLGPLLDYFASTCTTNDAQRNPVLPFADLRANQTRRLQELLKVFKTLNKTNVLWVPWLQQTSEGKQFSQKLGSLSESFNRYEDMSMVEVAQEDESAVQRSKKCDAVIASPPEIDQDQKRLEQNKGHLLPNKIEVLLVHSLRSHLKTIMLNSDLRSSVPNKID